MNCQISSDLDNLDKLHAIYSWIPNSDQIRPTDELIKKKDKDYANILNFYHTVIDYMYDFIFNFPTEMDSNGKLKSYNSQKLVKIFKPNKYPYKLDNNSKHYIMWYNCAEQPYSNEKINLDIKKEISQISNKYQFVWYENPSMSIPEIYHVQVFFIIV